MENFTQGHFAHIKKLWLSLSNAGITQDVATDEKRFISLTNKAAALTAIAITCCLPFSIAQQSYVLAILQLGDLVGVLSVLWLNFKGNNVIARQTYLAIINVFVLFNACFIGYTSHVHEFFCFSLILPFLLFSLKDYKNVVSGILMAVVCYSLFQLINPYFINFNLSAGVQAVVYTIETWVKFGLFGAAVYMLANNSHQSEAGVAVLNAKIERLASDLQRANQDIEQMAYIVSHDLKAPVRNISSFMSMLSTRYTKVLPPDALELTTMSKTCSDKLAKQIDDMIAYCRVDRNLPPAQVVDLNEMVRIIEIELTGKTKDAQLDVIIEHQLPVLKNVHSGMLRQVFQNLVANGIKFNENANRQIEIESFEETDFIRFSISDNGIGIGKGYEGKLFQMFKRLHGPEKYEGTGIGLAICKKIISYYGGEIWYEGTPASGTTFYFTLPKSLVTEPVIKTPEMVPQTELIYKAA